MQDSEKNTVLSEVSGVVFDIQRYSLYTMSRHQDNGLFKGLSTQVYLVSKPGISE